MRTWPLAVMVLVVCVVASPPNASGGVMMVDQDGETVMISKGKVKTVAEDEDEYIYIFDTNTGTMTMVDKSEKTYATGTADEYCAAVTSLAEEMLSDMDEEEREMMTAMRRALGRKTPPEVKVVSKGKGEPIAGLETVKYEVIVNGALYEEVWVTGERAVLGELAGIKEFGRSMDMMNRCAMESIGGGELSGAPELTAEYASLYEKGWPLRSFKPGEDSLDSGLQTNIQRVEFHDFPESDFLPPAGYRKVPIGELLRGEFE